MRPRSWTKGLMPASGSALACALLALSPAVADEGSGTMTVSGATVETVHYAATDVLHELRTSLAHREGAAGPSSTVDRFEAGTGKCYVIDGRITVSSNVAHDVLVSGDSTHPGLRFLSERPVDYEGCAGGEAVSGTMFASSFAPGGWVHDQPPSAQRVHRFAAALIIPPGTEPPKALSHASLIVAARPAS